ATDRAVQVAQGKVDPDALRTALTATAPATLPGIKDDGPAPNLGLPSDPHAHAAPTTKWGRGNKPPLTVSHAQVKDSVRAFYGNAPKSGALPTARLDEVLSPEIIAEMNLPPNGRLVEFGSWPATDRRGFEEVLAIPDGAAGSVGITVETPEGTVRDYVFLGDPNNTP
ncbi:MAG: hypothetical protein KC613_25505, partial [Myxococcales bacterium]|nr:hypothetical protein [Myxococcales bacterium]